MHVGARIELTARIQAFDRVAEIGDQGVIQEMHTGGHLTVRMDDGRPQFPRRNEVTVIPDDRRSSYERDLAAAKRAGRAWGCTCGADNPPHYDSCHECQRPSWTCAACGTVNTSARSDCDECSCTMPAELLGSREEGFEMTYEEWIGTQIGPRVVGGRYDHGDDASAYDVLAIDPGPRPLGTWPVWQITVRRADGQEHTHCSGWDPRRDRVRTDQTR
ncbi:hypothetical protein [Streptomyces sp. NPDC059783]|uniref:hypothetical protein n=1 Tax=Streptomyces sp. NPDC059783 TaxID=3346944 RepID=UPI00365CDE3E